MKMEKNVIRSMVAFMKVFYQKGCRMAGKRPFGAIVALPLLFLSSCVSLDSLFTQERPGERDNQLYLNFKNCWVQGFYYFSPKKAELITVRDPKEGKKYEIIYDDPGPQRGLRRGLLSFKVRLTNDVDREGKELAPVGHFFPPRGINQSDQINGLAVLSDEFDLVYGQSEEEGGELNHHLLLSTNNLGDFNGILRESITMEGAELQLYRQIGGPLKVAFHIKGDRISPSANLGRRLYRKDIDIGLNCLGLKDPNY